MFSPASAPQFSSLATSRPRFLLLDLTRFGAAMAVLVYHFTSRKTEVWGVPVAEQFPHLAPISAYGALGVQLFFVISGFVILLSAEGRTIGQFVSARAARLLPAYWAAVLLTTILLLWIAPRGDDAVSLPQFFANLTMLQETMGEPHVDGVYWTLWVELRFYVLIGIVLAFGLTERRMIGLAFLWPFLALVAQESGNAFLATLLSPSYAPLFAGGMVLYLIHSRGHSLLRWMLLGFNIAIAVRQTIAQEIYERMPKYSGFTGDELTAAIIVIGIFALVALITLTPLAHRGWRWMTYAGALTYPLYLIHEQWGRWIIETLHAEIPPIALLGLTVLACLLLAAAIERWVERPLRPILRRGLDRSFEALDRHRDHREESPEPAPGRRGASI
ncbi:MULTISPECIES: acyltransferase family protein [unclassified Leucobacter]|uniref:acyltransferase family protein n=1 Tax=unclassified Leucobacter TaxID=2621730 RepID=UPI000699C0A2|nr:acyltransferase [Leucobacter sp. Ag1]